ncbi:LamG domain-containing protein [Kribbella sp. NBC_01245]|uniref:LamG-like jellyroll fold domain-containing protein n=1 Tax=Kribbella sp. NBC_01245 TaxID=2903578 RepID=UPI002E2B14B9|nr:LamG-like jellyroll fold domain-containing protein [Kribbella sp. NBC_01245]
MKRALQTVAVTAALTIAATAPAEAVMSQRISWKFNTVASPVTTVIDDSGKSHLGTVTASNGGQITTVAPGRDGAGQAVQFPALCTGTGCPKAMISTPDEASLNPGALDFAYGAWVNVVPVELTADHGSNLLQKGLYNTAQWKLQLDKTSGTPSCVIREAGGADPKLVTSSVSISDGQWHKVTCQRIAGQFQILVDSIDRTAVPVTVAASYVVNPVGQPLTVGAKSIGTDNDQFHGRLDDVYFNVEKPVL